MASPDRIDPAVAAEIDRLATAFAKDPRSKAFMPLAESYIKAGMWQEAAAVLEDGLKVYPGFVTAMAALGRAYDQLGQPVKAKAILEEVVKQSPDNLRAHRVLAKIFASEGKTDAALKSCAVILGVNPYDEEALSIKHGITGDHQIPRTKREKKRRAGLSEPASAQKKDPPPQTTVAASAHEKEPMSASSLSEQDRNQYETNPAVARLETWLTTIQTRRRTDSPSS